MDGKHQSPPPRKSANREESRGLVKMSANCLSVSIYLISMPPSLHDLSESGVSSQHVSFLWKTGFLTTEMTLVLSHMRETLSNLTPKSLIVCTIQRFCEQQLHTRPRWWTVQLKIVFEKTSKREKIQENDKSQKCSFGQSHNSQNQHQKIQQDPAKKK
jgi:hypothetical protein